MLRKIRDLVVGDMKVAALSPHPLMITTSIIVAVIAVGLFLRVTALWPDSFLDQPNGRSGGGGDTIGVRGVPGVPAHRYLDAEQETSKKVIIPGESTAINFTLTNIWDTRLDISVPKTAALKERNWSEEEAIPVTVISSGKFSESLEPGEELRGLVNITPEMSAGLEPGKYTLRIETEILRPDRRERRTGFFSGFVVMPPEGALRSTVIVRHRREAHGTGVTLKEIHFSSEKTIVEALAAPLAGQPAVTVPFPAATRTVAGQLQKAEYLAASSVPRVGNLTARYRIDGGVWRQPRGHSYRKTAGGIHHE